MPTSDACVVHDRPSDPRITGSGHLLASSGPRTTGPGWNGATLSEVLFYMLMHFVIHGMYLIIITFVGMLWLVRK